MRWSQAIVLALVACRPLPAQASTLFEAWQAAQANDPAFEAARAHLAAAATNRPTALAALLPHFTLNAGAGPQMQYFAQPELKGNGFSPLTETEHLGAYTWSATMTQSLFDWTNIKTLQAADMSVRAAAANYQATQQGLAVTVTTDYVAVMAAGANLAALRTAQAGFGDEYAHAQALYRAGLAGVIGADEAGAAYQSIMVQALQAQAALVAARQALAAVIGNGVTVPAVGLPGRLALPPAGDVDDWLARAQTGNPALAALSLTTESDDDLVSAARGGYLPNVALQLQHTDNGTGGTAGYALSGETFPGSANSLQHINAVTVQMTWNIFDGGATHAAADQAAATRDEAVANAASTRLNIIKTIQTAYAALALDQAQLVAAHAAVTVASQAVSATQAGVRAGLVSESDLIADRQLLLSAELAGNAAAVAVITDETSLAQAAGTATPAMVQIISQALAATTSNKDN
jgi:outer membrane protein